MLRGSMSGCSVAGNVLCVLMCCWSCVVLSYFMYVKEIQVQFLLMKKHSLVIPDKDGTKIPSVVETICKTVGN